MAAFLALVSAMCFALAAALQQRGQFTLAHAGSAVRGLAGLFRLVAVPVWLLGTLILLAGYATQGVALGRGRLVVVQPLMVTTIVWALPLGYWLTSQHVVRRQVLGAGVVVVGLAMFVLVGDPNAGVDDASALGLVTCGRGDQCCGRVAHALAQDSDRSVGTSGRPRPVRQASSSGCRPASPSRSSTICRPASPRRPATGGPGPCSDSGLPHFSSSSCRWRRVSSRRRWRRCPCANPPSV